MIDLAIRPLAGDSEADACAGMMAASEPWLTLGIGYDSCLRVLRQEGRETFVAADEEGIAGLIVVSITSAAGPFVGYIQTLCVAPERRGQGIGTALVAFAEEIIFRKMPNVFLCVSSFNTGAQRLYEQLGYTRIGEIPAFFARGYSELLYRKTIGSWEEFRSAREAEPRIP